MTIVPSIPFDLQNGTEADATQVMADLNAIVSGVNTNAAANGANADITSLSGLTAALSVSQGGTGGNTAPLARTSLGAAASGANSDITALEAVSTVAAPTGAAMAIESDTGIAFTLLDGVTLCEVSVAPAVAVTSAVSLGQIAPLIAGTLKSVKVQSFTTTATYTPSAGMAFAYVRGCGAGGGGATNTSGTVGAAGGGSGCGFEGILTAAQLGASQIITIGAGGTAQNAGGITSIGALVSVGGGAGAQYINSSTNAPAGAGAANALVTSGLTALPGTAGGLGNGAGGWGGTNPSACGHGGPSIFGGGGVGAGNSGAGGSGSNGGGGGGGNGSAGGTGGNGLVIIYEFCTQ